MLQNFRSDIQPSGYLLHQSCRVRTAAVISEDARTPVAARLKLLPPFLSLSTDVYPGIFFTDND